MPLSAKALLRRPKIRRNHSFSSHRSAHSQYSTSSNMTLSLRRRTKKTTSSVSSKSSVHSKQQSDRTTIIEQMTLLTNKAQRRLLNKRRGDGKQNNKIDDATFSLGSDFEDGLIGDVMEMASVPSPSPPPPEIDQIDRNEQINQIYSLESNESYALDPRMKRVINCATPLFQLLDDLQDAVNRCTLQNYITDAIFPVCGSCESPSTSSADGNEANSSQRLSKGAVCGGADADASAGVDVAVGAGDNADAGIGLIPVASSDTVKDHISEISFSADECVPEEYFHV